LYTKISITTSKGGKVAITFYNNRIKRCIFYDIIHEKPFGSQLEGFFFFGSRQNLFAVDVHNFHLPQTKDRAPSFDIGEIDQLEPVFFGNLAETVFANADRNHRILKLVDATEHRLHAAPDFGGIPVYRERLDGVRVKSAAE